MYVVVSYGAYGSTLRNYHMVSYGACYMDGWMDGWADSQTDIKIDRQMFRQAVYSRGVIQSCRLSSS